MTTTPTRDAALETYLDEHADERLED